MKMLALVFMSVLPVLADPGAHMTPERAKRIEHAIKIQHAVLPISAKDAPIIDLPQGSTIEPQTAEKAIQKPKGQKHGTKR